MGKTPEKECCNPKCTEMIHVRKKICPKCGTEQKQKMAKPPKQETTKPQETEREPQSAGDMYQIAEKHQIDEALHLLKMCGSLDKAKQILETVAYIRKSD